MGRSAPANTGAKHIADAVDAESAPFPPAYLEHDPVFDELRQDARFKAQMTRLRGRQAEIRGRLPETLRKHGLPDLPPVTAVSS